MTELKCGVLFIRPSMKASCRSLVKRLAAKALCETPGGNGTEAPREGEPKAVAAVEGDLLAGDLDKDRGSGGVLAEGFTNPLRHLGLA